MCHIGKRQAEWARQHTSVAHDRDTCSGRPVTSGSCIYAAIIHMSVMPPCFLACSSVFPPAYSLMTAWHIIASSKRFHCHLAPAMHLQPSSCPSCSAETSASYLRSTLTPPCGHRPRGSEQPGCYSDTYSGWLCRHSITLSCWQLQYKSRPVV